MKLSLAMIVKDEESTLPRCLDGVKDGVDEIVIVDTGSADNTVKTAKRYAANVISMPWKEDFSLARNTAFSYCTGDYLLWLDADDVIPKESFSLLLALKERLAREQPDLVFCPYLSGELRYFRERIVKRRANFRFVGRVHECIVPRGKVIYDDFFVVHGGKEHRDPARNLGIYRKWRAEETLSGRDLFYYGRELCDNGLFEESAAVLQKMLEGDGWYVNKIEACRTLSRCFVGMGDENAALSALFGSFRFGEPRASVACDIASVFMAKQKFSEARFWWETALRCRDHSGEGDFDLPALRSVTPLLGLVVCCHALGDRDAALLYHKKSEAIAPDHPSVQYNRAFFGE